MKKSKTAAKGKERKEAVGVYSTASIPPGMVEVPVEIISISTQTSRHYLFEPVQCAVQSASQFSNCATPMRDCLIGIGLKDPFQRLQFPEDTVHIVDGKPNIKFAVKVCLIIARMCLRALIHCTIVACLS